MMTIELEKVELTEKEQKELENTVKILENLAKQQNESRQQSRSRTIESANNTIIRNSNKIVDVLVDEHRELIKVVQQYKALEKTTVNNNDKKQLIELRNQNIELRSQMEDLKRQHQRTIQRCPADTLESRINEAINDENDTLRDENIKLKEEINKYKTGFNPDWQDLFNKQKKEFELLEKNFTWMTQQKEACHKILNKACAKMGYVDFANDQDFVKTLEYPCFDRPSPFEMKIDDYKKENARLVSYNWELEAEINKLKDDNNALTDQNERLEKEVCRQAGIIDELETKLAKSITDNAKGFTPTIETTQTIPPMNQKLEMTESEYLGGLVADPVTF